MRTCSLIFAIIVLALLSVPLVAESSEAPVTIIERTYEGWLDIVGSDGYLWIYLQTPDRSQSFVMAYTGTGLTDKTSQIYVSGQVTSIYPNKKLVATMTDKRIASVPKPFFMRIGDIWLEFNRDPYHGNGSSPQARWVKVVGRIDKSSPDEICIVENGQRLKVDGYFDATDIANQSIVEAVGCLDSVYDETSKRNLPCILVYPEGASPLTYCYGSIRQIVP